MRELALKEAWAIIDLVIDQAVDFSEYRSRRREQAEVEKIIPFLSE